MKLNEHKEYSLARLRLISNEIKKIPELKSNSLCIYTTGSYGRLEASQNSDLDLFFIDSGTLPSKILCAKPSTIDVFPAK